MAVLVTERSGPPSRKLPTPEPGSLEDIILSHPNERIFVQPALWRAVHIELLDCTILPKESGSCPCFAERPPRAVAVLSYSNYSQAKEIHKSLLAADTTKSRDLKITKLIRFLTGNLVELSVSNPVYLSAFNEKKTGELWLNYYENRGMRLRFTITPQLRQHKQQHFAFLSQKQRPWIPQKVHIRGIPRKKDPDFVKYIRDLPIDPYYVAILIGQAQEICWSGDGAQYIKVNLLTPSRSLDYLILYSSYIPREYLKKFTKPQQYQRGKILISQVEISLQDLDKIIAIFSHVLEECRDNMSLLAQTIEANKPAESNDGKHSSDHQKIVDEKSFIDKDCTTDETQDLPVHETISRIAATTAESPSMQEHKDSTGTTKDKATSDSPILCPYCPKRKINSASIAEMAGKRTNTEDQAGNTGEPSLKRAKMME